MGPKLSAQKSLKIIGGVILLVKNSRRPFTLEIVKGRQGNFFFFFS